MRTIAFFNDKGGVGTTSLVYHLAWMYAELDVNVVAVDLDPQADLTSMFLADERLEALWGDRDGSTVFGAVRPLMEGGGDVTAPHVEQPAPGLGLVAGDLALSAAEDELANQWSGCMDREPRGFRVLSALRRVLRDAAEQTAAQLVLVDAGPGLGPFNRAALVVADDVVVPLVPDFYSLQGVRNLGPTLRRWRDEWRERRRRNPVADLGLPPGAMRLVGYVVLQRAVRLGRSARTGAGWRAFPAFTPPRCWMNRRRRGAPSTPTRDVWACSTRSPSSGRSRRRRASRCSRSSRPTAPLAGT